MKLHPYNQFLSLLDEAPDEIQVIHGDKSLTRRDLANLAGGIAQSLERIGVRQADDAGLPRALIRVSNSPEMMALILAVWAQGGLPMLLSPRAPDSHFHSIRELHNPAVTIDDEVVKALVGDPKTLPHRVIDENADASVVFTSGSTGRPKGVVQKGRTLTSGTIRISEHLGYTHRERILVPVPMSHDYGWNQMLAGLVSGHAIILPKTPALYEIGQAIEQNRPTVVAGVPSLYSGLLKGVSGFENVDASSVRFFISTGSRFPDWLYRTLAERVPEARILLNYGLTETFRSCCLKPEDPREESANLGLPVKDVSIIIVDDNGQELPPNTQGEIIHIGEGSFDRYLDDPDKSALTQRIIAGRLAVATGDIGYLDKAGYVYLTGRRDRLIKSMDTNVSLDEVEKIIRSLDGVVDVAVISKANDFTGTEIIAYCTLKTGLTPADLRKSVNRALPTYMQPRRLVTGSNFPRTPLGKIDYQAVKELCSANSS